MAEKNRFITDVSDIDSWGIIRKEDREDLPDEEKAETKPDDEKAEGEA